MFSIVFAVHKTSETQNLATMNSINGLKYNVDFWTPGLGNVAISLYLSSGVFCFYAE